MKNQKWPMQQAQLLLQKINGQIPKKGYVLFETGYGPSGIPHLGTFCEVARTLMVMKAFKYLAPHIPAKLFVYSDDMDGFRKVPTNIPNSEKFHQYIGKPLTEIPDPWGIHNSYGEHMNSKLREFLDNFGFDYIFQSATHNYRSGVFNEQLRLAAQNLDSILNIMQPSLGQERQATYNPFLPISPLTGKYVFEDVMDVNAKDCTITFKDEDSEIKTISIFDGNVKMQWKADWAMRWKAFSVDYEMHGKDITPSAVLSKQICKVLGSEGPITFPYELFTDIEGKRLSKSKGNGLSMEELLKYGPLGSLLYLVYDHPESSKKLHMGVIPYYTDLYIKESKLFKSLSEEEKAENPIFYLDIGKKEGTSIPHLTENFSLSFNLLVNLAAACAPETPEILGSFTKKYLASELSDQESTFLKEIESKVFRYYDDFEKAQRSIPQLSEEEKQKVKAFRGALARMDTENNNSSIDDYSNLVYDTGRQLGYDKKSMRNWFTLLYKAHFGQESGPQFGSFIKIAGPLNVLRLSEKALLD